MLLSGAGHGSGPWALGAGGFAIGGGSEKGFARCTPETSRTCEDDWPGERGCGAVPNGHFQQAGEGFHAPGAPETPVEKVMTCR